MSSLGTAGYPVEYAREIDEGVWRDKYRLDSHLAYFWSLPSRSSTPNGLFGLKLLWSQLDFLVRDIGRYTAIRTASPWGAVAAWMGDPIYFWLRRRDRLRQAVSYARALQTNRWASPDAGNGATPVYSRGDIELALRRVSQEEEGWEGYFVRGNALMEKVWYEDLAANPLRVVGALTGALGVPRPRVLASPLRRQADSLNDDWVERFSRENS